MSKGHRVVIPPFEPEVDALQIDVDGRTLTYVADMAALKGMADAKLTLDPDNPDPESFFTSLLLGLHRHHPEVTREDLDDWFPSLRHINLMSTALGDYLSYVVGGEEGDDDMGEAVGSTSGRGQDTT